MSHKIKNKSCKEVVQHEKSVITNNSTTREHILLKVLKTECVSSKLPNEFSQVVALRVRLKVRRRCCSERCKLKPFFFYKEAERFIN